MRETKALQDAHIEHVRLFAPRERTLIVNISAGELTLGAISRFLQGFGPFTPVALAAEGASDDDASVCVGCRERALATLAETGRPRRL